MAGGGGKRLSWLAVLRTGPWPVWGVGVGVGGNALAVPSSAPQCQGQRQPGWLPASRHLRLVLGPLSPRFH